MSPFLELATEECLSNEDLKRVSH